MTFNKYFQDELSYLRDLGDEFARENPNLVPFLSRESTDPDVERLLEAFAFLTGRLRQKLDDELPELSHSLISLLWPHYLRPVPSMTILEFMPTPGAITGRQRVEKGVMVESRPVENTNCRFCTAFDVDVYPMKLTGVTLENAAREAVMTVSFRLDDGVSFQTLDLTRLRLYLSFEQEQPVGRALYLWLNERLSSMTVRGAGGRSFTLPGSRLVPAGFAPDEAVVPYPRNAFPGYRILQEYFCFPQKFMFVDIEGLGRLVQLDGDRFEILFNFNEPFFEDTRITQNHLRINCCPIVNLFTMDGQPITLDHTKTEYRIRPAGINPQHHEIFSVDRVVGWVQGRGQRVVYEPFESFRHALGGNSQNGSIYYRTRIRPSVVGRSADTYISFVNSAENQVTPPTETISLALTCTNGNLAEIIPAGAIDQPTSSTPNFVTFRNIARLSPQIPPPIEGNLLWRLISNLARNFASLADLDALRTVLATYNFRAFYDQQAQRRLQLMLDGMKEVTVVPLEWLHRGLPVRGIKVRLALEESKFGGEGEMYLFASVLNEFLSLYASINACHQVEVNGIERNVIFTWPIREGQKPQL